MNLWTNGCEGKPSCYLEGMEHDHLKNAWSRWILFAVMLPWTLTVTWPLMLFLCIFAARGLKMEPYGILTAVWRPWATKIWRYSTTFGRGIIYQPGIRGKLYPGHPTENHEHTHIRQWEDVMAASFIIGLAVFFAVGVSTSTWGPAALIGLGVWWSGGMWMGGSFLAGLLRYGWTSSGLLFSLYYESEIERAARAQTSKWSGGKYQSWDDRETAKGADFWGQKQRSKA